MKLVRHNNVEDLEFTLLEEVKELHSDRVFKNEEIGSCLNNCLDESVYLHKVIGYLDDSIVVNGAKAENTVWTVADLKSQDLKKDFPIGMELFQTENSDGEYVFIKADLTEEEAEKLNEWRRSFIEKHNFGYWKKIALDNYEQFDYENTILTVRMIKDYYWVMLEQERKEKEVERGEQEEKKEEVDVKIEDQREKYDNESSCNIIDIHGNTVNSVTGNILQIGSRWSKCQFTFKGNVNAELTYDEVKDLFINSETCDKVMSNVELFLMDKMIKYEKTFDGRQRGTSGYSVTYLGNNVCVEGVGIPKAKLTTIIGSFDRGVKTADEIKALIDLTKEQSWFLSNETIRFSVGRYEKLPIEAELNGKNWKVTLFGIEKEFEWATVKKLLDICRDTCCINRNNLKNVTTEFGISKEDMFMEIKKVVLLKAMGEEE